MKKEIEKYNQIHYGEKSFSEKDEDQLLYHLTEIPPIESDVEISWNNIKSKITKSPGINIYLKIAAVLILAVGISASLWIIHRQKVVSDQLLTINGPIESVLSDGSIVKLSEKSSISFPDSFGESRQVSLKGKVYLEVKHDGRPFIIKINNSKIEVIGTQFILNESDDGLSVFVIEGIVKVFAGNKKEFLIKGGQEGYLNNKSKAFNFIQKPDYNDVAWATNKFEFENTSLTKVINTLEKNFNTSIRLSNKKLEKCTITGTFEANSIDEILNSIGIILNLKIQHQKNQILLKGKGC